MTYSWTFKEAAPGDRARESQVEKFFNSDAIANRANAIVREGIQNSLDASAEGSRVIVRIAIGSWGTLETPKRLKSYTAGFYDHFNAEAVRQKIATAPSPRDRFRYLVFEDFGTRGLDGDPAQWWPEDRGKPNPFFNYFRAEGISDKTEGARGRHGVGRLVFMFASRVRCIIALTRRRNPAHGKRELIMGTTVLRNHRVRGTPYLPDGWFGERDHADPRLVLPIDGETGFGKRFREDFKLSRENEQGLSVVVPWLVEDVTFAEIVKAVVAGYYYPILEDKLRVELQHEDEPPQMIDRTSIARVVAEQDPEFAAQLAPLIALATASLESPRFIELPRLEARAPKWDGEQMSESLCHTLHAALESGKPVPVRVPIMIRPHNAEAAQSHFAIFLQRDPSLAESQLQFIREGIIVTDARPRRTTGVRALIVIDEGPLASFLGDAENPSHTQWQKDLVKDRYRYAPATLDFVVQSVPALLAIVSKQHARPDAALLIDLFSAPAPAGGDTGKVESAKGRGGAEESPAAPRVAIQRRPKPFAIEPRTTGFVIKRGDPEAPLPAALSIRVAYGTRSGNPFTRYRRADFQLGAAPIALDMVGCEALILRDNHLLVRLHEDDFQVKAAGFDTEHRDLHLDVKARDGGEEDHAEAP